MVRKAESSRNTSGFTLMRCSGSDFIVIEKYSYLPKDETRDGAKLKEVEPEKE